ncbi:glycosyl hydrolase 5 family protein-like [Amaranthus tricolor]|uniref:glycosyl hydrolase 5 family protein-like n=1 Tax=Amaranthus tricolor TaxID=29722 RepID=UPI00258A4C94|nr:glycosyl hydrolase 5 family protein-like [Amaranthus tricolor]
MRNKLLFINTFFFFFFLLRASSLSLPLSTNSRWIVDQDGQRVKLACVNWVSHLELVVTEGLTKQPVDVITKKISDLGFNCVRFTWPLFLATNESLASQTVQQSFLNAGLADSIPDLQANNPSFLDLSLINAFQAVVESLTENKVMVILDNHLSKPGWCCSNSDGNGFFGDQYFDPELWISGLTKMATLFKDNPYVVAMSLRNELRGPRQNANDWYRYMQRGAEAVHGANPNILIILSGLNFDKDFKFLNNQPVSLTFTGKLVFEMHWYAFTDGEAWKNGNPNEVCGKVTNYIMGMSGFLLSKGFPLFVSEWGVDLRGTNENDNRYLNCILAWIADNDLDWALWTWAGTYYLRQGVKGMVEYYGLLNSDWTDVRNSSFLDRISVLQSPLQGPGLSERNKHKIIYHPSTGLCIQRKPVMGVQLGNCLESNHWTYTPEKSLTIKGSYFCLQAQGLNSPARLSIQCAGMGTSWTPISDSKLHLSATLRKSSNVCLDVDSNNNVITSKCKCLSKDSKCDPESQWFKIVDATDVITTGLQSQAQGHSLS